MKRITNNERLRVAVLLGFIFFTTVFLPGFTKLTSGYFTKTSQGSLPI
jgi:hypothetical protein